MNSMFFSGETEARAVLAAANHFGVSPEQVVFDRVEKRHGFVKHRRVVIRVDPASVGGSAGPDAAAHREDHDVQSDQAAERFVEAEEDAGVTSGRSGRGEPAAPPPEPTRAEDEAAETADTPAPVPAPALVSDDVVPVARDALNQLLELADVEVSAEIVLADGRLEVELEGVDEELLIEEDGQALMALQHLLPRVMYGQLDRIVLCRVDCGGYQRQREERLRGLALRVGEEVARQGAARTLRPMNPADRRIVHLTLADDPEVETESQGNGYFKRVSIRPL